MIRPLATIEDGVAALALAAMVVLPLLEILVRRVLGVGLPGSGPFVQHLTLWVGFLGAAIVGFCGTAQINLLFMGHVAGVHPGKLLR